MNSPQVFISYSRADKAFADRLQDDLLRIGVSVWKDDKELIPGESVSGQLEQAITNSDYFFFILSVTSIASRWVDTEYRLALNSQIAKGKPRVLPIRLHEVEFPPFLWDRQYVDFVNNYAAGWTVLSKLFSPSDLSALRLGGASGTGIFLLKFFIAQFRAKFPQSTIQERIGISEELIAAVASTITDANLDAAVVGNIPDGTYKQRIEYREVFIDISVLTVFPGHQLWGVEAISEKDLLSFFGQHPAFISRPKGSGLHEAMMSYLKPRLGMNEAERLLGRFVASDLNTLRRFVSEGRGISIMPNIIISEDVLSGKIWAVRLPGNVQRPFYGVWAKDRSRSSVAEEFIALLKAGLE